MRSRAESARRRAKGSRGRPPSLKTVPIGGPTSARVLQPLAQLRQKSLKLDIFRGSQNCRYDACGVSCTRPTQIRRVRGGRRLLLGTVAAAAQLAGLPSPTGTSFRHRLPTLPSLVRGANEIRTTDNAFEEATRIAPEDLNNHSRGFSGWLDPIQHHPRPTLRASGYKLNQGC